MAAPRGKLSATQSQAVNIGGSISILLIGTCTLLYKSYAFHESLFNIVFLAKRYIYIYIYIYGSSNPCATRTAYISV